MSFSDPVPRLVEGRTVFAGHIGIVYQAKGAVFCGRSSSATKVLLRAGTVLDNRALSKVRGREQGHAYVGRRLIAAGARLPRARESGREWLTQALREAGATRLRHRGNYRYAFALGRSRSERRRVRIAALARPYPKSLDAA